MVIVVLKWSILTSDDSFDYLSNGTFNLDKMISLVKMANRI
jgi:hypothetical protein